jgi:hypothetical protein
LAKHLLFFIDRINDTREDFSLTSRTAQVHANVEAGVKLPFDPEDAD